MTPEIPQIPLSPLSVVCMLCYALRKQIIADWQNEIHIFSKNQNP